MSQAVHDMFGRIAPGYDRANRWLSAGRDVAWRRKAIRDLPAHLKSGRALDVACGTGDLALDLRRMGTVTDIVGVDFLPTHIGRRHRSHGSRQSDSPAGRRHAIAVCR